MTQNSKPKISWFSKIAASAFVIGLILLMPVGPVQAQDFKKVQKRLDKMVKKDLISGEQAAAMMMTLKKSADKANGHAKKSMSEAGMKAMAGKIEAAAKSGVITRAQARKKHEHLRQEFAKSHSEHSDHGDEEMMRKKKRYSAASKEIKAAVKAGGISEEDAEQRLGEMREHMFGEKSNHDGHDEQDDDNDDKTDGMMRRLRMAVESGRITEEQATERARQYKTRLMEERYKAAASVIKEAMEAGIFSKEEAEERLLLMRKAMFGVYENRGETEEKLRAFGMELRKAVADGKLTEDKARKEYEAYRKELAENQEGDDHEKDERHERNHDDSGGHDDDGKHHHDREHHEGDRDRDRD